MLKKPIRFLYLPNESKEGDQYGPRIVFNKLYQEGMFSQVCVYSYRIEKDRFNNFEEWEHSFFNFLTEFNPDVIFWQHIGEFQLSEGILKKIKQIKSNPTIVYQDGDVYGRLSKRVSSSFKKIIKYADLVFCVGYGDYQKYIENLGAKRVIYFPNFGDTYRFGGQWKPTNFREIDVVFIGNNIKSSIPFLNMPGTSQREKLVKRLSAEFGNKFALYGEGWDGNSSWRGSISFNNQETVIRNSWLSVGWNHFHNIPGYFSNRLPNSMLTGVAHVTNYHIGYENIFENGKHLYYSHSVNEMVNDIIKILNGPKSELMNVGENGKDCVIANLSVDVILRKITETIIDYRCS